jgi:Ca2+-binding RTX toxin-like protein
MVDVATDVVIEAANEGIDTVQSAVTWTLGANLENLTLTGSATTNAAGNFLDNALTGNSANNLLTGDAGNDTLNGGAGTDTLIGGTGNDVYVVDVATDVVAELAGEGTDTVQSALTWTLSETLENLTLTGHAAINGIGNALDNVLTGNYGNNALTGGAGNDTLNGGGSADTMVGGLGNDTYVVDIIYDVITEAASEGIDTVQSAVSWTLGANLENLTLTGSAALNGTGNTLNNVLTGNAGANVLTGGAGNDTYIGGLGSDTLSDTSTTSNDIYAWGRAQGADTVTDAGGTDRLDILAGVTEDQVWLRQIGSNLELSVIGTTDRLTINGWYTSPSNQIESFRLSDGQALLASQVQQLVNAMATFAPPAAGQTTLPTNYATTLTPVIAPSWA